MIIIEQKEYIADWVCKRIGADEPTGAYATIGIVKNEKLVGAALIDSFVGKMCSIHCAGDGNWCSLLFIRTVFSYVFSQIQCNAVLNVVSSENVRSLRFTKHLGFKEVYRVKGGCGEFDAVLLELQKIDCRWL